MMMVTVGARRAGGSTFRLGPCCDTAFSRGVFLLRGPCLIDALFEGDSIGCAGAVKAVEMTARVATRETRMKRARPRGVTLAATAPPLCKGSARGEGRAKQMRTFAERF